MDTYQAISLMVAFGMLIVSLISLVVVLIKAITEGKK